MDQKIKKERHFSKCFFLYVLQKKASYTGLEWHEGAKIMMFIRVELSLLMPLISFGSFFVNGLFFSTAEHECIIGWMVNQIVQF